jgi:S-DNA-T family DNA segregation ATPase FtsK/SpoIIIE
VVVIAAPGGPLSDETGDRWTTLPSWAVRAGTADLLASLDTDPTATLVVDDLSVLPDHVEGHLLARLDGVARGTGDPAASTCWPSGAGPHVLAACTPSEAAVAFRGLAARLRTTGSGILLTPIAPGDGEAFGMRVPARSGAPPGRALVLAAGRPQAVQVAVPE